MSAVIKTIYHIYFDTAPQQVNNAVEYVKVLIRAELQNYLYSGKPSSKEMIERLLDLNHD